MPPLNVNNTLGAVFIGNIAGAILFGITTLQTFVYFQGSANDHWSFRLLIGFLWILDSLQLAFMTQGVYSYVILNFMNVAALLNPPWTFFGQVIITCLSDLIVRSIFARRIWRLSNHNKPLLFCVIFTSLVVFGSAMVFSIRGIVGVSFVNSIHHAWLLYTALGTTVLTDMLIATSICLLLNHSRSGFKSSDSLVNTLIIYTINTGVLTSLFATACFITFAIWPHTFIFIGIYFVLGKLYINAVLAILNSREFLRARKAGVSTIPLSPSAVEPIENINMCKSSISNNS